MRCTRILFVDAWRSAVLVGLFLLAAAAPLWGQSGDQASLAGTAFDASDAVVVGAHVKVRDLNTSFAASTTTNYHGMFRFAVLPVGLYELTADHAGFATVQVNKIDLTVGANLTLTLRFSVASTKEAMTVSDEVPSLEKTRSQLSTTIDNRLISELPVNGRDFTAFVLLPPGVRMEV